MPKIIEVESEKPPPLKNAIRQPDSTRVRSSSHVRSFARRREMATIYHLSSPFVGSRFRNDLVVLASV